MVQGFQKRQWHSGASSRRLRDHLIPFAILFQFSRSLTKAMTFQSVQRLGDPAPKCRFPCSDGVSWHHETENWLTISLTLAYPWHLGSLRHLHLLKICKHVFMVSSSCRFTWNQAWITHHASSFHDHSDYLLCVKQFNNANYKSVVVWHLVLARLLSSAHVAWPCVLTLAPIATHL